MLRHALSNTGRANTGRGTLQTANRFGRVVVAISTEGLRIPAVNVGLRNLDGNVVPRADVRSDAVGQVTFPDVPAGRYVIRAIRDGFADGESAPFMCTAALPNKSWSRCA